MDKIKDLEKAVYDEYYQRNPKGDARYTLWGFVIEAKKDKTGEEPESLLSDVEDGYYDGL